MSHFSLFSPWIVPIKKCKNWRTLAGYLLKLEGKQMRSQFLATLTILVYTFAIFL